MGEIALMCPLLQIRAGEDADGKIGSVGNRHDPALGLGVPNYFWVAELRAVDIEDGVGDVGCECISTVDGISDVLVLDCSV